MKRVAAGVAALALAAWPASDARANGRFPAAFQLVVEPGNEAHIAVQTSYGFISTRDSGASWTWTCEAAASYGGTLDPPIALLQDGVLIAGVFDGLVVASPDGCTLGFATGEVEDSFVVDVSTERGDPTHAIAVSSNGLGQNQFDTRVWATTDGATTWAALGVPLPTDFLALTLDSAPSDPSILYLSGFVVDASSAYAGALARSSDAGQSWQITMIEGSGNGSGPYLAAIDPIDPDTLYVRLAGDVGVLLASADAGATFTQYQAMGKLTGFALSPDGTEIRIGGETDGILAATAPGLSFTQVSDVHARCLTWTQGALYACGSEAKDGFTVGRSTDGGATFEPIHHLSCLDGPDPACGEATTIATECPGPWAAQRQILQTELCGSGAGGSGGADFGTVIPVGGGCATSGADSPWMGFAAALGIMAAWARRRRQSSVLVLPLLAMSLSFGAGCGGIDRTAQTPAQTAANAVDEAPDQRALEALEGLALSPDQKKTIAAQLLGLAEVLLEAKDARQQLVAAILEGIAAGRLDHPRVEAAVNAFVAATEKAKPQLLDAANDLHRTLTPEQRARLIDGASQRGKEGEDESKERAKRFVEALDLSFGQKMDLAETMGQLSDQKEKLEQLKADLKAAATAFKSNTFDATTLSIAREPVVHYWLRQTVRMIDLVVPVLDDYQRQVLVEMARRMMSSEPGAEKREVNRQGEKAASRP